MKISNIGQHEDHKMYKLTSKRMKTVNDCLKNHKGATPNYPHTGTACSGKYLYQLIVSCLIRLSCTGFHPETYDSRSHIGGVLNEVDCLRLTESEKIPTHRSQDNYIVTTVVGLAESILSVIQESITRFRPTCQHDLR